ncbi:MAG: rRNA maturation RNase YbeY [Elainellaceae cyanobacterium]
MGDKQMDDKQMDDKQADRDGEQEQEAMAIASVDVGLQVSAAASQLVAQASSSSSIPPFTTDAVSVLDLPTWSRWMVAWLAALQPGLSRSEDYELGVLLTDDVGIQQFNRDYRHQDSPTDVLSFATLDVEGAPDWHPDCPVYLGDIVISVETTQRQARDRHHSFTRELAWLAAHGLLHLLGWDHPDDIRLEEMLQQQDILLAAVGGAAGEQQPESARQRSN